jgi:GAF domain-containing protein
MLGPRSAMVVPLVVRDQNLGVISLVSTTSGRRYGVADLALAEDLARRAALAVDSARLFGESQARIRETETLLAVGQTLSSTLDPTEQMRRVARQIARGLNADMVGAFLADPAHELLHPIAGYHVPKELVDKFIQFPIPIKGHLVIEEAWTTGRAVWTSDVAADPRTDPESVRRFPHQSDLFVPMIAKGKPVGGFFVVWWHERRRFTPDEVRFVEGICDQAGMLVENARLYSEATRRQREAEAAYEELSRAQAQLVRAETLRALGELASGAAHHLNNLLTVILGRVQLAREVREADEIQRLLAAAERATFDAAEVVRRMGNVSRAHPASAVFPVQLNEVVQEVLELTRPRWGDDAVSSPRGRGRLGFGAVQRPRDEGGPEMREPSRPPPKISRDEGGARDARRLPVVPFRGLERLVDFLQRELV